jgi:hypothetical protein
MSVVTEISFLCNQRYRRERETPATTPQASAVPAASF